MPKASKGPATATTNAGQACLVGGIPTPLKNDGVRQLGLLFPIWWESHKNHVPNHQPAVVNDTRGFPPDTNIAKSIESPLNWPRQANGFCGQPPQHFKLQSALTCTFRNMFYLYLQTVWIIIKCCICCAIHHRSYQKVPCWHWGPCSCKIPSSFGK